VVEVVEVKELHLLQVDQVEVEHIILQEQQEILLL
jgi:hypothetical protein